jgi:predicted porin
MDGLRMFDLADRRQHSLSGRVDYALAESLDGSLALRVNDADYPSRYGRIGHERSGAATLDVNYQAGPKASLYGFYAYQASRMEQRGVQPNACVLGYTYYFYSDGRMLSTATGAPAPATPAGTTLVSTQNGTAGDWAGVCGTASPSSPLFPDSRAWDVESNDRNHSLGFGVRYDFGRARLDANFTRVIARTRIGYAYNAAALGMTPAQAALAGSGPSDLTFAQNVLNANILVPINARFTLRALVRYEMGKVRDWHYDGIADTPTPVNNALYLNAGPQDYRATILGLFLHVRL